MLAWCKYGASIVLAWCKYGAFKWARWQFTWFFFDVWGLVF